MTFKDFLRCCQSSCLEHSSKFQCHLETKTPAFYKLAPLKLEILNLDPYVVVYHEAISDMEIMDLKQKCLADMQLHPYPDAILTLNQTETLYKHISLITGLDVKGFEELTVVNYGIGGDAELHYDFYAENTGDIPVAQESRKATAILYLSDVEQGGASVFPLQQLQIAPRKGSFVLWHNLKDNGNPEWRSLHGACPIIFGTKWAAQLYIQDKPSLENCMF